jgi:tripartite-type tricarboxylate transporter receptor subunit TctC
LLGAVSGGASGRGALLYPIASTVKWSYLMTGAPMAPFSVAGASAPFASHVVGGRTFIKSLALCLALIVANAPAHAQDTYPSKPIQLVVTTAAGGALDLIARTTAERLTESLRQPVIIENQPAGNGSVAAGQFAKATPDGHTLMMVVDSTVTINPHLYRNLPYDPFRDFAPISLITRLSLVLVANPAVPANDLRELIAYAKANPGKLSYASTGIGTQLHIGMELFKLMTKTDILHVPYRATVTAMTDLLGGRIDLALLGLSSAKAQLENGKLRALAIAAPQRSPLIPNVPTMEEAGLPGYEVTSWFGSFAPARTPPVIIDRLAREIRQAAAHPKFVAALTPLGMEILATAPDEMARAMRRDSEKWGKVIAETDTRVNQ